MKQMIKTFTVAAGLTGFIQAAFGGGLPECPLGRMAVSHPERIERLFADLDLDHPGLEAVKAEREFGRIVPACRELLSYYQKKAADCAPPFLSAPIAGLQALGLTTADDVISDRFIFQNTAGIVPRDASGRLDWNYTPNGSYHWTNPLNRHFHLGLLMSAFKETGNSVYAKRISADLKDWILSSPYEGKAYRPSESDARQWSLLETGTRCEVWSKVFFEMNNHLSEEAKILMLSSVPDHLHCIRSFHSKGGNHLAIEIRGLAMMAAAFQEFKEARPILDYAAAVMSGSLNDQVYPDGVQKELTSHYHAVAYRAFAAFRNIYRDVGIPLPDSFCALVDNMLDYTAYVQRPDGTGPNNNDSDVVFIRENILAVLDEAGREDWRYIATNGKEGTVPERLSVFYPWAGQAVMRSGWDNQAQWSFFDVGPWGIGHQHSDKLHLSVTAGGRDLLVDAGRYTYDGYAGGPDHPWREYFISSASHNVVLIDGAGQKPNVRAVKEPLENVFLSRPGYDFCRGEYTEGYHGLQGTVSHTRAVLYLSNRLWVVADRVRTDRPRRIQVLWHWHPDCNVILDGESAVSDDPGLANLRILPAAAFSWDVQLVRGQENPVIQGWYSAIMGERQPAATALYETEIADEATFVWLLTVDSETSPVRARITDFSESPDGISFLAELSGGDPFRFYIPITGAVETVSVERDER